MFSSHSLLSTLAACLPLATLVTSLPAVDQHLSGLRRDGPVDQNVFYNVNGADVKTRIAKLKAAGYQPTSLSIHGTPADAKYAGIWTKQDGNAYETILGANRTAYNAWIEQWKANGYVSTHVSATGSASDAVFAGVMQQIPSVRNWVQECGLDSPFAYLNITMGTPMVIKGVSLYGTPQQRQYCVLGHEDTDNHQQSVSYPIESPVRDYKEIEAEQTSKRFWRPVFIDKSEDMLLTPIFDDTSVGRWTALTDLTLQQLRLELAAQKAKNLHPISIAGAGSANAKYAVIFAERVTPLKREWHITGSVTGFNDNAGLSNALDGVMQAFMTRNSVRQAQVAASFNGTVIASRGYTWAESDRAIVQPSDKFLLGSVSKTFTYAATDQLVSSGRLNLTTRVYPLLGYNKPKDPRSLDITVQHLLDHAGGFDRGMSPDIGFIFTTVAQKLNQSSPVSLRQLIEYVYEQPLDFTPGERSVYCNYGTLMLSYIVSNLTGESYTSYLQKHILSGLDVELYSTSSTDHTRDPIVQETKSVGISALTPSSPIRVSGVYGGDGAVKEAAVGSFALRASASTVSRFMANHNIYGIGPRQAWNYRDGTVEGARALAYSQGDIDWVLLLNTRSYVNEQAWEQLVFGDVYDIWGRFVRKGT